MARTKNGEMRRSTGGIAPNNLQLAELRRLMEGGIKKKRSSTEAGESSSSSNKTESIIDGQLIKQSTDGKETFLFFYTQKTPFSNFYPSKFVLDGNEFNCTEQYFHYAKAVEFGDNEAAAQILDSKSPGQQKQLGRKVKNYNEKRWGEVGPERMKQGIMAKFQQNAELNDVLLKTVGQTLVEASPRDRKWGIGLSSNNPKSIDRRQWRGKNLLGNILMEVRDALKQNDGDGTSTMD